jgi:hypothetical protein
MCFSGQREVLVVGGSQKQDNMIGSKSATARKELTKGRLLDHSA